MTVVSDDGVSVSFGAGDLVTFESGLRCTWHVNKALRKHYYFD
ncbi:MAG: cupin domain-containing protein [Methylophilus sp.]